MKTSSKHAAEVNQVHTNRARANPFFSRTQPTRPLNQPHRNNKLTTRPHTRSRAHAHTRTRAHAHTPAAHGHHGDAGQGPGVCGQIGAAVRDGSGGSGQCAPRHLHHRSARRAALVSVRPGGASGFEFRLWVALSKSLCLSVSASVSLSLCLSAVSVSLLSLPALSLAHNRSKPKPARLNLFAPRIHAGPPLQGCKLIVIHVQYWGPVTVVFADKQHILVFVGIFL